MKACSMCGEVKSLYGYHKRASSKDGYRANCKACCGKTKNRWYNKNKKHVLDINKKYREENKDEIFESRKGYYREYRKENKKRLALNGRVWYNENKERLRLNRLNRTCEERKNKADQKRRWHIKYYSTPENNALRTANAVNKRARKRKRTPLWVDQKKVSGFYVRCAQITIKTGIAHHVDHIVPLNGERVSGLHVENNLQILTGKENLKKGNNF